MTCAELQRDAAGLAMLPHDAPERIEAERHAADCAECRAALAKGEALRVLLDEMPAPEAPPPAVLARVAAELRAETARSDVRAGRAVAVTVALSCIVLLVFARQHAGGTLVWLGTILVGLGAVAAGLAGVRLGARITLAAAAVSTAFAFIAGSGGATELGGTLHCFLSELIAGGVALGVAVVVRSRQGELAGPGFLGATAAAGALAGQAALNVVCHTRDALPHLLISHTGGVIVAALVGAAIGAVRRSPQIV